MCSKQLVALLFLVFSAECNEEWNRHSDSASAGTDFVAFPPISLGAPRVFQGPPDLTALQQTHVLGNFHHRFHPPRLGFNYASNPSQSLYVPQTHITPPQEQNQRSHQQGPVLRPPGPPPGPNLNAPFGPNQDQSIKNSFPSNSPHTIKFSISSQNYNPNQGRHFGNSAATQLPPPKITHQLTSNPSQGQSFVSSGPQGQGARPLINQAPASNFQAPFHVPSKNEFGNFPNPLIRPVQQPFASSQASSSLDSSVQFNGLKQQPSYNARGEQNNVIPGGAFSGPKPGLGSGGHGNLDTFPRTNSQSSHHQARSQAPLIQSSIELKQDDLFRQQTLDKQQITQSNFGFPKVESHELYTPSETPSKQSFNTPDQQQQQQQKLPQQHQLTKLNQNTQQNYFEYRTTESPRQRATVGLEEQVSETVRSVAPTRPTSSSSNKDRKLALQKSQDHLRAALNGNFLSKQEHSTNEIIPTVTSAAPEFFTTVSTTYRKSKPSVKEITINLSDQKITGERIPSQLYIKEDRQKEFQAIKAKEEKAHRYKSEKSQEELINEQIQKLLQSHNLEIIGKDSEAQTNSQEVQLSKVSEQFKKYNYSVQLLNGGGLLSDLKSKSKEKSSILPPLPELPDHIKNQYDVKLIHKDELLKQFDISGDSSLSNGSLTPGNVFLANGQNLEIVRFSKDGTMDKIPIGTKAGTSQSLTTAKPPKVLFEELTKQVLPPGADFELIKHKGNGEVEKVESLTGEKKVTFVFLEEQPDGSVKIQGIKGNSNDGTEENEDVDSLIKKIKNGSLKLPPSEAVKGGRYRNEIRGLGSTTEKIFDVTTRQSHSNSAGPASRGPSTEFVRSSPYSIDPGSKSASQLRVTTPKPPTTFLPTLNHVRSSTGKPNDRVRSNYQNFLPTTAPTADGLFTSTFGAKRLKATSSPWHVDADDPGTTYPRHETSPTADGEILSHRSTEFRGQRVREPQDVIAEESIINAVRPLNEVLKENGLNEMAKFLDQSGLNAILNETGPYTIFIPTDKAFKTLESQLGGPDKAEDKFRENPRLLSGLLLHHVVPGSFRVEDLQDEMTGVSLAGTQLRVNTYPADEKRSKSGDVVTINGAKVSGEQKDIVVPQGLAHSIDRVLFPLPVGDIVQTLKSDRERRFTKFLKALDYSGLTDLLTGSKTYTVFAPTDKAFSVLTDAELEKLLTKREAAKTIALRHIVPGTLYTAGMNYFQVRDSMETGQKITIRKEIGKIKANSAQIISANIPATNGVIHAVETLL